MNTDYVFAVHKRPFLLRQVVVIVPMQGFAKKILPPVNYTRLVNHIIHDSPNNAGDAVLRYLPEILRHTLH